MYSESILAIFNTDLKTTFSPLKKKSVRKKRLNWVSISIHFHRTGSLTVLVQSRFNNSCLPYHLSHHHFHQFLPAEDSIHTLHGHVGLAFQPWLEKAERNNSSC